MSTLKLEAATANKLIELLSSNDKFRDLFSSDPLAAMVELGLQPDDGLKQFVGTCCAKITLADKETIVSAKEALQSMLTRGMDQSVPMLDANQAGGRTLK
ncbi:hypothetical protein ARC20_01575 [Stenotrophomonas panacihumi]|uniref:Nif11 domain-containing protein n=1 Tax=Stenotrophomonas panacihumi TaxID=676599 RepID=A0A0R0AEE5_9GAMM|nr:NHLP-related RiPP peptide [Stenotrophomonas panacihumi]KRG40458.1 hypothetical protein ARC20_01575 [Stenotrophomonas panacihumi]PTN54410.1 putative modified peptide [Stenotrophomonas panacihumi]